MIYSLPDFYIVVYFLQVYVFNFDCSVLVELFLKILCEDQFSVLFKSINIVKKS